MPRTVSVAQSVRAPDCGSGGRGFNSPHSPHRAAPPPAVRHLRWLGALALGLAACGERAPDASDEARGRFGREEGPGPRHLVLVTVDTLRGESGMLGEADEDGTGSSAVAVGPGGPLAIGELLDASHRSMRDDFEISVPELDLAVETAVDAGAIGARMTGGGFGGAAIALVKLDDLSRVQVAVDNAFSEHGFAAPDTFVVRASDGAARN